MHVALIRGEAPNFALSLRNRNRNRNRNPMNRRLDHEKLWRIVSMLVALIKANSSYRLHDGNFASGSE